MILFQCQVGKSQSIEGLMSGRLYMNMQECVLLGEERLIPGAAVGM